MHIQEESVDDLLNGVYTSLLGSKKFVTTSKGKTVESIGAILSLKNPRARLSSSETRLRLFSALGEIVWYLAGSDDRDLIAHYIRYYAGTKLANGRVPGAYGPRLFGTAPNDQIAKVIEVLKQRPTSRRAVVQLYRAEDLALSVGATSTSELLDVPCTCTLQFLIRVEALQLLVNMRSNDAYMGLPHDIFCFTMLQELVARALDTEPGAYFHIVGSLHLYEEDLPSAREYLYEGWHNAAPMPPMPHGNQMRNANSLVEAEREIRKTHGTSALIGLPPYWRNLGILLHTHDALTNTPPKQHIEILRSAREQVEGEVFKRYLLDRQHAICDRPQERREA